LDILGLLIDFRVFFYGWQFYRLLEIRSQSGFVLLRIGIGIERNLNIVAYIKTGFEGSFYRDICVELRLICNKVSRPKGLAWLLSTASIAV
jgi:hypothetical protein